MDDSFEKELERRLSRDPFPGSGFDARLRRRIEERLEGHPGRLGKPRRNRPVWGWPATAFVSMAVLLLAVWMWGGPNGGSGEQGQSGPAEAETLPRTLTSAPAAGYEAKKYALLLGLRKDAETASGTPASEYRTMLVAADREPDRLRLMAELPDLYVPYGQNFWRVYTVESPGMRQTLQTYQATRGKSASRPENAKIPDSLLSERVDYAGNAYLSIYSVFKDESGGTSGIRQVKHIEQLNAKTDNPAIAMYTSPNVFMEWSIYRNPGKWVSELNDPNTGQSQKVPSIPEDIVQHDTLNMSWKEIQSIEPAARDAFTYGNILGIVAKREIRVYAMKGGAPVSDPVRIPLAEGENVVMIQWAQNDKIDYVEKWIQDLRSLSGQS